MKYITDRPTGPSETAPGGRQAQKHLSPLALSQPFRPRERKQKPPLHSPSQMDNYVI
jgi:hypothetical protein